MHNLQFVYFRPSNLNNSADNQESLSSGLSGEDDPLLRYCYPLLYGPNYGFRTLVEFDDECPEGDACNEENDEQVIENVENGDEIPNRNIETKERYDPGIFHIVCLIKWHILMYLYTFIRKAYNVIYRILQMIKDLN